MNDQSAWLKVALGAGAGFLCGVLLIVVLAVTTGSEGSPARTTGAPTATVAGVAVPDVVGLRLDVARERLEGGGFAVERDVGGLFGVVVESNWQVRAQRPGGGERRVRGATVELFVERP